MKTAELFNRDWYFRKCGDEAVDPAAWQMGEAVQLPHTWYRDGDYYQGDAVYQKRFPLPLDAGRRAFLRFEGVDKCCAVWLNGRKLGEHKGGYTAFAVELTEALTSGENLLTVLVNNERGETVSPLSGDFASFGGIYRNVTLFTTDSACFDRTWYGTSGVLFRAQVAADGSGRVECEARTLGELPADAKIVWTLFGPDGAEVCRAEAPAGEKALLEVDQPQLWNGRAGAALYRAQAVLTCGGAVLDEFEAQVGFRRISVDPEAGFFLNGEHLKLHGVAKHQDTAGVFSAAGEAEWRKDFDLILEMGANAVRLSHYPHAQGVYDLCDRDGLVVWAEIPMLKLTQNDELLDNAADQLREMILQNLHHPSVCFWGIQNEVAIFGDKPYMTERLKKLNALAHELDPARITVSANLNAVACESTLNRITDATTYNVYYGWYYGKFPDHAAFLDEFHAKNPLMPLAISEYGADCSTAFHSDKPQRNDYTEEYQALYHESVYPYMAERDFVWGSFVWNMFDFVSPIRNAGGVVARNLKGLVTHDRETRKDAFYYYKAVWSEEPFVRIAEQRFVNRAAGAITVKVYSNQPEVTLETAQGTRTARSDTGVFRFEDVPLAPGENRLTAVAGACRDTCAFVRVAEPDPAYTYTAEDVGINVRNWFVDEQEEARLFPEDACSIRDKMETLLAIPAAMAVIDGLLPKLGKLMRGAIPTFTLEQAIQFEKPDCTEDDVKKLNAELNKIAK